MQSTFVFSVRAFFVVFAVAVAAILVGLVLGMHSEYPIVVWTAVSAGALAYFLYALISGRSPLSFAIALFWLVIIEPAPCDILAGLGALAWFVHCAALKRVPVGLSFAEALFVLFALVNAATILLGPKPFSEVDVVLHVLITAYLVAFCLIVSQVLDSSESLKRVLKIYFIPCVITCCALILGFCFQKLHVDLFGLKDIIVLEGRPRGFFKDPNVAGPSLILGGLYCLTKIVYGEGKQSRMYAVFLGLFFVGILLTFSRGALVSFVVGAFCVLMMSGKFFSARVFGRVVTALVIGGAVLWYVVGVDKVTGRIVDRNFGVDDRLQRIESGVEYISENVFMGVGMMLEPDRTPHDSYFFVLVQSGVVGFVLLWGPIFYIVFNLFRKSRMGRTTGEKTVLVTLASCMVAHLLIGTAVYILHWRHFWLLVGMSVAALRGLDRGSADVHQIPKKIAARPSETVKNQAV
jgi:hypothetical protein